MGLSAGGVLLVVSALRMLSVPEASAPRHWRKRCPWFVLLAFCFYLLGLLSTCYFRAPPPGMDPARLDIWGRAEDLYRPTLSFLGIIWMTLGLLARTNLRLMRGACATLLVFLFLANTRQTGSHERAMKRSVFRRWCRGLQAGQFKGRGCPAGSCDGPKRFQIDTI